MGGRGSRRAGTRAPTLRLGRSLALPKNAVRNASIPAIECGGTPAGPTALTPLLALLPTLLLAAMAMADMPPSASLPDFDALWDYNDPAGTEAKFRELLPQAPTGDVAKSAAWRLELLTQIARTEGLQRKFDAAHQTLDGVEAKLADAPPVVRVRCLLERGRVFNSAGMKDKTKPLFLEAWQAAGKAGLDFHAVDAAHMLGIIEPPADALSWNEKALAMAEKSSDARARNWRGSLYNNIGWTYHDLGQYEQALDMFEKALVWHEEQGQEKETRIARWCVARVLRSLNRIPEALAILRELEPVADGYTYEELGECLLLQGKQEEAQSYFARAHEILSQDEWLVANEAPRLERLRELAKV